VAKLKVTQRRSVIDRPREQKATIRALGLHRINDSVVKEDRPEIRGMIAAVRHLVDVEELEFQGGSSPSEAKGSADPLAEGRRRGRRTEESENEE
jgi:large subunit ribosomal protein L30